MVAAASPYPTHVPTPGQEQRVLLNNVPWSTYVVLRDSLDLAGVNVRLTYLNGALEIMSPSRDHEVSKKQIARFLELFCLERDIPLFGYGSMTMRDERLDRGLEPDECYCRGGDRPVPDLALELIVSRGSIDKLEIYRALGVREVWLFEEGAFKVLALHGAGYVLVAASEVIPELDLSELVRFVTMPDQHAALRAFRDLVRRPPG